MLDLTIRERVHLTNLLSPSAISKHTTYCEICQSIDHKLNGDQPAPTSLGFKGRMIGVHRIAIEAAAVALETRADSLIHDSHNPLAATEASNCANVVRGLASKTDEVIARMEIFASVSNIREQQDERWGGPDNDDALSTDGWRALRLQQEDKLSHELGDDFEYQRRHLLNIAALAIAHVEAIDRELVRVKHGVVALSGREE
jgi:hypothetical protein